VIITLDVSETSWDNLPTAADVLAATAYSRQLN
jgi:hypothetical protein